MIIQQQIKQSIKTILERNIIQLEKSLNNWDINEQKFSKEEIENHVKLLKKLKNKLDRNNVS